MLDKTSAALKLDWIVPRRRRDGPAIHYAEHGGYILSVSLLPSGDWWWGIFQSEKGPPLQHGFGGKSPLAARDAGETALREFLAQMVEPAS